MPPNIWPHMYKHLWRKLNSLIAWLDQAQAASTAVSWAAEQCTALVSLCTRQDLSVHVGANKAAFKWVSRLKASFMQDFCLEIFFGECLKKRKEHDFSFSQKTNPLTSALGVGYSPSWEYCSVDSRSEHHSVMLFLWNSWDVVFSLTLCTGILTPLPHPGVCARRAKLPLWLDIGQQVCLCHTEEFWFVLKNIHRSPEKHSFLCHIHLSQGRAWLLLWSQTKLSICISG